MRAHDDVLLVEVKASPDAEYTRREELLHTISHGLGFVAAAIGSMALMAAASGHGSILHIVGVGIFGVTLTLLYASSALYHGLPESSAKRVMRKFDHASIYLLIAGTYTPFVLIKMQYTWAWALLALIWALALLGIVLELVRKSATRRTSLALYLVMGWLAVFTLKSLHETLEPAGVALLIVGGITYTVGIAFYAWDRLPYNHAVWHGFVLGGSSLHFASVIGMVVS